MRRFVLAYALAAVGCHDAAQPTSFPVNKPGIRITDGAYARKFAAHTKHTMLPFEFIPEGVNGTALITQFLRQAEAHGATYASDLSITMQLVRDGTAIECVSKVVVDDGTPAPAPAEPQAAAATDDADYTTTIKPWKPAQIESEVDDHEFVCTKYGEQIVEWVPAIDNRTGAETKRWIAQEDIPLVRDAKIVWHDDCHLEPRHRKVMRYETFIAARYEPPDWDRVAHQYAEHHVIELPPVCHQIPTPKQVVQRVEADLGYLGQLGHTTSDDPTPLPKLW